MIWLCSGSSRPRRPWIRRTTRAVASDEDSGENLLSQWDRCEEADAMLIVQDFLCIFVDSLWKVGQSICNNGVASMFFAPCVYRQGIFYEPWHPDFYKPDRVKCVLLKILWQQRSYNKEPLSHAAFRQKNKIEGYSNKEQFEFENDIGVGLFSIEVFSLALDWHAHHNPKNVPWVSGVSILKSCNCYLQVS